MSANAPAPLRRPMTADRALIPTETSAYGPACNPAFFSKWLIPMIKTDVYYSKLFMCTINIAPFTEEFTHDLIVTTTRLAWIGKWVLLKPRTPVSRDAYTVGTWADLLAPALDASFLMTEMDSRTLLRQVVQALITCPSLGSYSTGDKTAFAAVVRDNENVVSRERKWDNPQRTPEEALEILMFLAASATRVVSQGGVSMLVNVLISVVKRGTISQAFADKVRDGVEADLHISGLAIEDQAVSMFYKVYGSGINDEVIESVVNRWLGYIPGHALRLRLTVEKAAGSRITSIATIGKAMNLHRAFQWKRVRRIFPREMANVRTAVQAIKGNMWYGLKQNLGVARSTNFPNIAYVAKELLVKVDGLSSLNAYKGWIRRAVHQGTLDTMIAEFETYRTDLALERPTTYVVDTAEEGSDVGEIQNTVVAYPNVYV